MNNNEGNISVASLTPREHEVLKWLALGKSNPDISQVLEITHRTVEKHCENIYNKLGVENRISAARVWLSASANEKEL